MTELVGPRLRTWIVTELTGYVWALSTTSLALFCYLLQQMPWRVTVALSCTPYAAMLLIYAAIVPESPHWHLKRGEFDRVEAILIQLLGHDGGGCFLSRPSYANAALGLCAEEHSRTCSGGATDTSSLAQPVDSPSGGVGSADRIYLWSTISLSYYAISFNAGNLSASVYLNFTLISLPVLFSGAASARLMDSPAFGRKGALAAFLASVVVAISTGVAVPSMALYSSMAGTFAAEAAFALIYMQVQELFPTDVRSSALGLCSATSRLANLAASLLPILLGSEATLALIVVICAVALPLTCCCLPETRGSALG